MTFVHSNPGQGKAENNKKWFIQSVILPKCTVLLYFPTPDKTLNNNAGRAKNNTAGSKRILWQITCSLIIVEEKHANRILITGVFFYGCLIKCWIAQRVGGLKKPRIILSSEQPLSSCKQQLCLFTCSVTLPADSRTWSTGYPHKRDQPNNASCSCESELRTSYFANDYDP